MLAPPAPVILLGEQYQQRVVHAWSHFQKWCAIPPEVVCNCRSGVQLRVAGDGALDAYYQSFAQSLSVWGEGRCGTHPVRLRGRMSTTR